ncbi:vegetative cell wall protein gp1-like [Raphanus sativus]|uniref:Vegetative cell wall protein gp1-like n=1 Tax=Raphanus sativus TaxID=3726 RepID=A0A6J0L0D1_RAPSA|nr:vegetative cell wall protein gp1-like [Raphanus sativus]KAJ4875601.1 vegetative cell wall protein gp1-like [Raphanus sativus]
MVSLTVSHVKVEVDLTKPLPSVFEFERESGEVVEVYVNYPWVPPTCSHCHELGHVIRNCLHYTPPPPAPPTVDKSQANKPAAQTTPASKTTRQIYRKKVAELKNTNHGSVSETGGSRTDDMMLDTVPPPSAPTGSITPAASDSCFTPVPTPRPSLKRSRSSPTLSPPITSNPNPFMLPFPPSSSSKTPFLPPSLPSSILPPPSKNPFLSKNQFSPLSLAPDPPKKPLSPSNQLIITSFFSRESASNGGDPPSTSQ